MTEVVTPQADTAPVTPPAPTPQPVGIQVPPAAPPVPKTAILEDPVFLSRLGKEALQSGDITAESYKELEAAGIPELLAKQYVQGQIAQHKQTLTKIHSECGGEAAVNEAVQWAAKNMAQGDIDAINQQLASPNPEVVITALKGLQSRAGVSTHSTVAGRAGTAAGLQAYESEAQMLADQASPQYRSDPAFRATVQSRLRAALQTGKIAMTGIYDKGQQ